MKGKRGDVADRHTLAVSGVYCVSWCSSIMLYCSSSHWSPQAGHRQRGGVCVRERGGEGVCTNERTNTLFGRKPRLFPGPAVHVSCCVSV